MGARVPTRITQHTIWQALTGELPPLELPPTPIAHAALDSRDIRVNDLFVALPGENTDGHRYIGDALRNGAIAVLCEARGQTAAYEIGATVVDCRKSGRATEAQAALRPDGGGRPVSAQRELPTRQLPEANGEGTHHSAPVSLSGASSSAVTGALSGSLAGPLVFLVDDSVAGLQRVGGFQRMHRSRADLSVIGITGSIGKTSTKELTASVVKQRYCTLHNRGNLNSEQGLPLTLLELGPEHERAVLEMGMYGLGEIDTLCRLTRPRVGVITNVGPSHLSRLGSIERIAQAKAELVQALPPEDEGGVAILNWDDEHVRAMAAQTKARVFRYGLTPEADLWADEIESAGMEGIRFRFHYRKTPESIGRSGKSIESLHVRVPLLGRHSVHTALRAAAVGLVEQLSWEEIVAGMQNMPGQIRLVAASGINGSTVIDDTYNASPASTVAALNLLHDLTPDGSGRRVAVLGDMRELGDYTSEGHQIVGRRAADVVDLLVTVGELGQAIGAEAVAAGLAAGQVQTFSGADETIDYLRRTLREGDLVLVKGSRAVGMEVIAQEITLDAKARERSAH